MTSELSRGDEVLAVSAFFGSLREERMEKLLIPKTIRMRMMRINKILIILLFLDLAEIGIDVELLCWTGEASCIFSVFH
jgi:hypothetical protein